MFRAAHALSGSLAIAICAGAAALADAGARPAVRPARALCGSPAGHTLSAGAHARVYSIRGQVYGCSGRAGRVYRLGSRTGCVAARQVGPVAVVGDLAAYGSQSCGIDTGSAQIVVRRLSDDKLLLSQRANSLPLGPESYDSVTAVALRANGEVAWISLGSSIVSHARDVEVHERDRLGAHLLDSGVTVGPQSLSLRGARLTWIHGGWLRSAQLA